MSRLSFTNNLTPKEIAEKVSELLSKENLTIEEKSFLTEAFDNNPELKKYESIYKLLGNMKDNFHLNSDIISEYVLYKNGLPLEDNSIIKFIPQIENHIEKCSKCREEFKLFNEEYNEIDNYITEKVSQNEKEQLTEKKKSPVIIELFTKRYNFAYAAAIAFFIFSFVALYQFTTPKYKNINELSVLNNYSVTRGRTSPDFYNGLKALSNKNYSKAILHLKEDIKNNPNDKTIFYTNYMLGLIYLKHSESDFLGLFKSFNETEIDSAIFHFTESVKKNNSGAFPNITYNSYYFIAKGYLLQDNLNAAKKYLQLVVNNRGSYSDEAKELLELIDQKTN